MDKAACGKCFDFRTIIEIVLSGLLVPVGICYTVDPTRPNQTYDTFGCNIPIELSSFVHGVSAVGYMLGMLVLNVMYSQIIKPPYSLAFRIANYGSVSFVALFMTFQGIICIFFGRSKCGCPLEENRYHNLTEMPSETNHLAPQAGVDTIENSSKLRAFVYISSFIMEVLAFVSVTIMATLGSMKRNDLVHFIKETPNWLI